MLAALCGAVSVLHFASSSTGQSDSSTTVAAGDRSKQSLVQQGRRLFVEGCSSCHGWGARGVPDQGPSLIDAGAAAADFYLRTGRMPLDDPGEQPLRSEPRYSEQEIEALDAYVGSLGGEAIPKVDTSAGNLAEGMREFQASCAGCHSTSAEGGVAIGAYAPPLKASTPTQVGEAIRVGPFVMPNFSRQQISDQEVNSIARYVELTKDPQDDGGWGIGHIGPVPEGLIAWALAAVALLLLARVVGERGEE